MHHTQNLLGKNQTIAIQQKIETHKVTQPQDRVVDGYGWIRKECNLWMLAESVSVYQVLNVVNDGMFKI